MINRNKLEHILEYAKQQRHIGQSCKVPPEDMVEIMERLLSACNPPAQSDCCPAQNHVSPEQNSVTPAQSPIDHGYRPECECSGCKATARICAELAGNSPVIGIDLASGPERTVEVRYVALPGYMMVPREPTKQMILAGQEELESCIDNGFDSDIDGNRYDYTDIVPDAPHRVFMAMLAAAPQEVKP